MDPLDLKDFLNVDLAKLANPACPATLNSMVKDPATFAAAIHSGEHNGSLHRISLKIQIFLTGCKEHIYEGSLVLAWLSPNPASP
jgi:hypothetical protein